MVFNKSNASERPQDFCGRTVKFFSRESQEVDERAALRHPRFT
jgi:hypothetical protein